MEEADDSFCVEVLRLAQKVPGRAANSCALLLMPVDVQNEWGRMFHPGCLAASRKLLFLVDEELGTNEFVEIRPVRARQEKYGQELNPTGLPST
jgi:hypothetical protein